MTINMRTYISPLDFLAVGEFLRGLYQPDNRVGIWFQAIWEYALTHAWFDEESARRIGIWEDGAKIVGVTTYELRIGEAFFQIHPDYSHLKPEMLAYAEQRFSGMSDDGRRYLKVFVNDFDTEFEQLVLSRGYTLYPRLHRPMSQFVIPDPFPQIRLPNGFRLKSLADDNDLSKIDRVLWRGFNHPGEPPNDSSLGRKKMQSGPHFRKDLNIVVEAPNSAFVAYGGLWFDPVNKFGYVEPVATDPDHRRRGLGTAAVLEGIRRCGELGAIVAYVASDRDFYLSMGFRKLFIQNCWIRYFEAA